MGSIWTCRERDDGTDGGGSSDARLVEALRRRAPGAFAGLHEHYATGIYNLALRVVRHAQDAEDITQDVLIRAFERLPRDREVVLRPWLYRLTLNRCYDYLRGAARRATPAAPGRDMPSPDDPFEQSELQRLLEEALGDLTRRQRAALLLKDVHGLTLVEVGACLEMTPGSVEVLLARARKAFRAAFSDRCRAAGRPLPSTAGGLAALPLVPLPPALAVPSPAFAPPVAVPPVPATPAGFLPPLTAAAGSGISAALGLPSSVKTAVLVAAAAATMSTAEVAVHQADQRPLRPVAGAPALVVPGPAGTRTAVPSADTATPAASESPLPAVAPRGIASEPAATPPPDPAGDEQPGPAASPLAIPTPTVQPTASPMPDETASPQPTASCSPAPETCSPTPSPSTSASPSLPPTPTSEPAPDPSR
ncbi:MAG: sigma-70 family RNA polymerase sigma factor [Actinobacteria bacterium]|nr:sigma-70 family RNA polymerase sigma factor [Actinomycetota bacterium]